MPFSPAVTEEKPYNRCIDCIYIGKKCDGPNFLAMGMPRLCEWLKMRKEYLHSQDPKWTNAYIANLAGVSLATVNRVFAGDVDDIKLSTIAQIIRVLVNGTWGQYPCSLAAGETQPDCEHLKELLVSEKAKTAFLKEQIAFKDKQLEVKDTVIAQRGEFAVNQRRDIHILSFLLVCCVVVILFALCVDRMNNDIGFFWVNGETNLFGAAVIIVMTIIVTIVLVLLHFDRKKAREAQKQKAT